MQIARNVDQAKLKSLGDFSSLHSGIGHLSERGGWFSFRVSCGKNGMSDSALLVLVSACCIQILHLGWRQGSSNQNYKYCVLILLNISIFNLITKQGTATKWNVVSSVCIQKSVFAITYKIRCKSSVLYVWAVLQQWWRLLGVYSQEVCTHLSKGQFWKPAIWYFDSYLSWGPFEECFPLVYGDNFFAANICLMGIALIV